MSDDEITVSDDAITVSDDAITVPDDAITVSEEMITAPDDEPILRGCESGQTTAQRGVRRCPAFECNVTGIQVGGRSVLEYE
ncbi:hypothetical protein [Halobellus ordinarius]|uniref:hypothetical protein n=1 Tax=Halobellus ordinarius TaxID=3075120 RepID=UPI00288074A3|nr:hypothetical protein [Halobellus sp. ZY16]